MRGACFVQRGMPHLSQPMLARIRPLLVLGTYYLLVCLALRLVLWWQFGRAAQVGAGSLPWILGAGNLADFIESLYLLAPFAIYLIAAPDSWLRARWNRRGLTVAAALWIFAVTFLAIVEYYFFEEFDSRFNLVSVDYLMYPTEVVGDIRDAYPVNTVLLIVALWSIVVTWALRHRLTAKAVGGPHRSRRLTSFIAYTLALLIVSVGIDNDAVALSQNRVANELASNGPASFFRALRSSEIDYHAYYATRSPEDNLRVLTRQLASGGGRFTRLPEGLPTRAFPADPNGLGRLNVVVVVEESFGAEFSRLYGSPRNWTPHFDALAREGLWFRHMYASGTRTVRGLEAIAASFPPIPSVSIVRRRGNENIATWGSVMRKQGYHTSFLYGGYGYFDNMNAFFGHNGFDVLDRSDLGHEPRFANVWGVADEDLFDMALAHFDDLQRSGQPFFSILMTTSNHKPFTFRDGVPGVKREGGGREAGVRYADYALGYFISKAQEHAWFPNTLFVVVADHGARVYGRQDIPLRTYEIPMLFYSPAHLSPGVVDTLTSQIDIAPTVLGLLGLPYEAPFFGVNVLKASAQDRIALFNHNFDVAILEHDELAILGLHKTLQAARYDRESESYQPVPENTALANLAVAYYQTAYELFRAHRYE